MQVAYFQYLFMLPESSVPDLFSGSAAQGCHQDFKLPGIWNYQAGNLFNN